MPAHSLTPATSPAVAAVRALLADSGLAAAAQAGIDPDDLADAAAVYHAAGTAALEQRAAARWCQLRIRLTGQDHSERTVAAVLGPRLDTLTAEGGAAGWWFMRKPPGWRIRLLDADTPAVSRLLAGLAADGIDAARTPSPYEPETTAFGGPTGMDIAHALFCADSRGVLGYLSCGDPPAGRRELSVLLISAMLTAAGLDWFERGDVFGRVARMRPEIPAGGTAKTGQLAAQLKVMLAVPVPAGLPVLTAGGGAGFAVRWLTAFQDAGRRFAGAAESGTLGRGLRTVLAHAVIFHWNRLGLTATTQAVLARAATTAYLPQD